MDILELARYVRLMRTVQKEYFRTGAHEWMIESKRLEGMVDRMVSDILSGQEELFDETPISGP